jgi:hypothetical protein
MTKMNASTENVSIMVFVMRSDFSIEIDFSLLSNLLFKMLLQFIRQCKKRIGFIQLFDHLCTKMDFKGFDYHQNITISPFYIFLSQNQYIFPSREGSFSVR